MREFFQWWRRKVGVGTLVLACVFTAGWVRSWSIQDVVTCHTGTYAEYLMSLNGALALERKHGPQTDAWKKLGLNLKWHTNPDIGVPWGVSKNQSLKWRWNIIGFGIGDVAAEDFYGDRVIVLAAPYWSIILPLTLLSAWLLLSKPRKSMQKPVEPTATIGA